MYMRRDQELVPGALPYNFGYAEAFTPVAAKDGKLYRFASRQAGATTAVYVPDAALGTNPVTLLVWIHGDLICGGEGASAVSLVQSERFPFVKQIAASKLPLGLVAPSMGTQGQNAYRLGSPQKMNTFLEEVRTGLASAGWSSAPSFGRLILAGHSRAYAVLNGLAGAVRDAEWSNGALATLTDMWLVDATYGKTHVSVLCDSWIRWAKAKRGVNLRILYRTGRATGDVAECIRRQARKAGLSNVDFQEVNPALKHCDMPRMQMPSLLATIGGRSAASSGTNPPRPATWPAPGAQSPAARPATGTLPQQVRNALASGQWDRALQLAVQSGQRDANTLTNMIFFARHPELHERNLVASEPNYRPLSREWLSIRDRLVRPFLAKTAVARPPAVQPTQPVAGGGLYPEVNTLLPQSGSGFERKKAEATSYGLPETIRALQEIAAAWHAAHPQGPRILVHDISRRGGGKLNPHKSHQVGLDVDILLEGGKASWYTKKWPKNNGFYSWVLNPIYSRSLTQQLAHLIIEHPKGGLKLKFILFDDPDVLSISSKVKQDKTSPHRDHLHLRFCAPSYFKAQADKYHCP
jgi:hypothetical protein